MESTLSKGDFPQPMRSAIVVYKPVRLLIVLTKAVSVADFPERRRQSRINGQLDQTQGE